MLMTALAALKREATGLLTCSATYEINLDIWRGEGVVVDVVVCLALIALLLVSGSCLAFLLA